jgi:hypothetical protein
MSILFAPPIIAFINTDLTTEVQSVFQRQFYLTAIMDGYTFDGYVATIPDFPAFVHQNMQRILVLRDLSDFTNRDLADIVLFAKTGLVSVLFNKYGPPNITLPIDRCYLTDLINLEKYHELNKHFFHHHRVSNSQFYYDQFGNIRNNDFNPHHLDLPLIPVPKDA